MQTVLGSRYLDETGKNHLLKDGETHESLSLHIRHPRIYIFSVQKGTLTEVSTGADQKRQYGGHNNATNTPSFMWTTLVKSHQLFLHTLGSPIFHFSMEPYLYKQTRY